MLFILCREKNEDVKMAFYEEIKTKEELYEALIWIYDLDEKTAEIIIDNLANRHKLSESEEILLASHGIEQDFIESIQNNKNLNGYNTEEPNISLVGPFFYINKKLYTHSVAVKDFKNDERFCNDPISHFDYFNSLGIPGDYGNYPRGRVIYDILRDEYIVYMDKSIMTDDIMESVMLAYCLEERKTVFKTDAHYKHDNL